MKDSEDVEIMWSMYRASDHLKLFNTYNQMAAIRYCKREGIRGQLIKGRVEYWERYLTPLLYMDTNNRLAFL